mmetsp:Transcript_35784/g.70106  ORF Transcript_35784/g.70106 Transcript_35784/m.70106 type:complete len:275 (+) Transcript_35784:70-894(+)
MKASLFLPTVLAACVFQESLGFGYLALPGTTRRLALAASTCHPLKLRGGAVATAMSSKGTLYVKKAADGSAGLGDCPFCHKAHMALKLKGLDFSCEYIDLQNKPSWYLEMNEKGSVPTWKSEEGTLITESDDIVNFADTDGTGPKIVGLSGAEEAGALAVAVWKSFATIMKNKDQAAEKDLVSDLRKAMAALDSSLSASGKKFLVGDTPSAVDCKAGPFLLHASVALPHYKQIDPFEGAPAVKAYLETLKGLDAFKETSYGDSAIVAGWAKFFA